MVDKRKSLDAEDLSAEHKNRRVLKRTHVARNAKIIAPLVGYFLHR